VKVLLASTSPYRKTLLQQLNIQFTVVAPTVDEALLKKSAQVSLPDLPLFLAQKKAESVAAQFPQDVVIGSDQMGLFKGQALDKPGTKDKAISQLQKMQGATHQLLTALCVIHKGKPHQHVDITELTMRALTEAQIKNYVDLENPIDCAGSYKFEGLGIALFEKAQTKDPSAIVGLPLMALTQILEKLHVQVL
jgi:septum formation protein